MAIKAVRITRELDYQVNNQPVTERFFFKYTIQNNTPVWFEVSITVSDDTCRLYGEAYFARDYRAFQPFTTAEPELAWWLTPPMSTLDDLFAQALANPDTPLPAPKPGVNWVVFTNAGQLVTELRSYVDEKGNPLRHAGKLNLPSGGPESSDQSPLVTLLREFYEEHSHKLFKKDVLKLGEMYDPEIGQTIHSYRIVPTYEDILLRERQSRASMLFRLLTTESLGHPLFWAEDLLFVVQAGAFVPQAAWLIQNRPEDYLPASRFA